ncbi:7 transmembrane receptor [Plakobranchus ocellatus]|uniref:7 transmembrane receptor n=1 Tax=Plakobranchus ocellatus TaxID=259542 RepID=A0AAV4B6G2_9GAST|nr:7 transmembrane receptor [Plakobranchus ocellatus]
MVISRQLRLLLGQNAPIWKDLASKSTSFSLHNNDSVRVEASTGFENQDKLSIRNEKVSKAQSAFASDPDIAPQNTTFSSGIENSFVKFTSPTLGSLSMPSTQVNGWGNETILSGSLGHSKTSTGFLYENSSRGNLSLTQLNQNESNPFLSSLNATTEPLSSDTNKRPKVRIWDQGLLKRHVLNIILAYIRKAIAVPVGFSLIAVGLTVAVFKDKSFRYSGKPMVISFNIFEGLKCIAYLLFRMMKLYTGDARITWNSTYARFFVYHVLWLPEALGRIGILHNGLITLDRFFTIAFPISRLNKRLVTRPKTCVAVIVVSMFLYQLAPLIMFFSYVEPRLDYEKTFSNDEIISEIYVANPAAFRTYWIVLIVGHACFTYTPLIAAILFNILTIISLWRHEKTRAALTEKQSCPSSRPSAKNVSSKRQTNRMIVGSSLVFAILVLFRRLLPVFSLFIPHFGEGRREMHIYILCNEIFHLIDCLSPVANLISYTTLSSQFQRSLKEILIPSACVSKTQD